MPPIAIVLLLLAANPCLGYDAAVRDTVKSGSFAMTLPLGLQGDSAYVPEANPMNEGKVELGRLLYFDARLSKDGTVSCATCHSPFHGFTDPSPVSAGVAGQLGGRNSPTVLNRLFSANQFWDGRAADLEEQAHGPLVNPVEMAMASHDDVVAVVKGVAGYAPHFAKGFGDAAVTMTRIAQAIATYERTVVTGNSAYDRYQAGDKSAMSAAAVRGMELFNGKANCATCHASFNFSDENYRNIGVGMDRADPDLGRYVVSKNEEDRGAFKTPTLRNIVHTAPYMHDGSEATLMDVVDFYDRGGVKNPHLSSDIRPLHLTGPAKQDLVEFMLSLTGDVLNAAPPESLPK